MRSSLGWLRVRTWTSIRPLAAVCRRRRVLALTFDDGPGPELTPQLLELLASHSAKATFFLLGRRVVLAREIVERIAGEGHELGCHSHDHLNAWKTMPRRITDDIDRGYEVLSPWVASDGIFRPPYGKLTPVGASAIRCRGAKIGWWTIDSGDTWSKLPKPVDVGNRVRAAGGGVVLMHDFDREDETQVERHKFVLEATESLLRLAKEENLRICTLGSILGDQGGRSG